jgi:hypothetical protein
MLLKRGFDSKQNGLSAFEDGGAAEHDLDAALDEQHGQGERGDVVLRCQRQHVAQALEERRIGRQRHCRLAPAGCRRRRAALAHQMEHYLHAPQRRMPRNEELAYRSHVYYYCTCSGTLCYLVLVRHIEHNRLELLPIVQATIRNETLSMHHTTFRILTIFKKKKNRQIVKNRSAISSQ